MIGFLFKPGEYFERNPEVGAKSAILPAIVIAVIGAISQYFILGTLLKVLPPNEIFQNLSVIAPVIGFISTLITILVIIAVISGIIHIISSAFGGEGAFGRTFGVVGFGFYPLALASIIQFLLQYYMLSNATIESLPDFLAVITNRNLLYGGLIINLSALVWSTAIWSSGVSKIRKIDFRKAVISSIIPAIIYLAFSIYSLMNIQNLANLGAMPI